MRIVFPLVALALAGLTAGGSARAESAYTSISDDKCQVVSRDDETGDVDLRCPGYKDLDVFISDGDARTDVDFGLKNENFETFSAFNTAGDKVEWMIEGGKPTAAAIRYKISTDGRSAEAIVVSKVGAAKTPGCVVAVVDATADQANGVARGLGAMARLFDCRTHRVVVVPGASELVRGFSGANQ